jgi:hypothetical protein
MFREERLASRIRRNDRAIGRRLAWPLAVVVIAGLSLLGWVGIAYLVRWILHA